MKKLIASFAGAVALTALAGAASATPIVAGTTVAPSANATFPTGLTQVASTTGTITAATFTANYTTSVYRTAAGTLDFVYDFSNSSNSANSIESFTAYNFDGFAADVSYVTGTGVVPVTSTRTASGTIGFDFTAATPVGRGASADTLIIATNATTYNASGLLSLQDGSAGTGTGFQPTSVSAAPEPGTWALMLGGVGMLGLMLRGRLARRRDDVSGFSTI